MTRILRSEVDRAVIQVDMRSGKERRDALTPPDPVWLQVIKLSGLQLTTNWVKQLEEVGLRTIQPWARLDITRNSRHHGQAAQWVIGQVGSDDDAFLAVAAYTVELRSIQQLPMALLCQPHRGRGSR